MKILGLSLLLALLSLSGTTRGRKQHNSASVRKLDDGAGDEEEYEEEGETVDDENPDLEMLDELEDELGGGNIFKELMEQKMEMIERLEMLEKMVDEDLLHSEDPDDPLNKKNKTSTVVDSTEEFENYIVLHRNRIIKVFVLALIVGFVLLVGWKISSISADLVKKKAAVKSFQQKLDKVDEKEIDSLVASWKDQREGISKSRPLSNRSVHRQPDPQPRAGRAGLVQTEPPPPGHFEARDRDRAEAEGLDPPRRKGEVLPRGNREAALRVQPDQEEGLGGGQGARLV